MKIIQALKNRQALSLDIVLFLSGSLVMVYELAGSRVLAPYLGTSIYVWTGLIGVILACLSLGYWFGGRLSDKRTDGKLLAVILFAAGIFVALTYLIKDPTLMTLSKTFSSLGTRSVIAAIILFGPASLLMGMVSPYIIRLKLKDVESAGQTAGTLYAISTMGSIFGTFAAGFWLIPLVGTGNILLGIAALLIVCSMILSLRSLFAVRAAVIAVIIIIAISAQFAAAANFQKNGFVDIDSQYNRIWIYSGVMNNRPTVNLMTDPFGTQCAVYKDGDDLPFSYYNFFQTYKQFKPSPARALMLGGCAYVYPRAFLRENPSSTMDVVEIDPKFKDIAEKYFRLADNPRLDIIHEDARTFINRDHQKYDIIFGDAFTSALSIPFQLTTKEAVEREYDLLNDDGVVVLNTISAVQGDSGRFLRAEYETYKSIFPQVYVFPLGAPRQNGYERQNVILVAAKSSQPLDFNSSDPELSKWLDKRWTGSIIDDMPILTDDFAPVESYGEDML